MDPENGLNFQIIKITRNLKNYLRATQEKFSSESSKLQYYRGIIINACLRDEERLAFVSKCSVSKFAE